MLDFSSHRCDAIAEQVFMLVLSMCKSQEHALLALMKFSIEHIDVGEVTYEVRCFSCQQPRLARSFDKLACTQPCAELTW